MIGVDFPNDFHILSRRARLNASPATKQYNEKPGFHTVYTVHTFTVVTPRRRANDHSWTPYLVVFLEG